MSLYGLFVWLRDKTYVAEARLCLAMFAFFFLVNVCFNGYHGGFSAGPRYLVPGAAFPRAAPHRRLPAVAEDHGRPRDRLLHPTGPADRDRRTEFARRGRTRADR